MIDVVSLDKMLSEYGWLPEDRERVIAAYQNGGIEAAVAEVAWMDDDQEHDYQGEMRDCIGRWEAEQK